MPSKTNEADATRRQVMQLLLELSRHGMGHFTIQFVLIAVASAGVASAAAVALEGRPARVVAFAFLFAVLVGVLAGFLRRDYRQQQEELRKFRVLLLELDLSYTESEGGASLSHAPLKQIALAGDLTQLVTRATQVIGDRDEALRWLGTPLHVLAFETPISRLATPEGKNEVLAVLDQLEHGVF
jgi:hypothetical protein